MEEWKTVEIKEICTGIFEGPHATPKESSVGGYYLGIPAIGSDGHINFENAKRISEDDLPAWTKRVVPQEDDIVFTNEATLNLYAIIPAGFHGCLGRRLGLIRPNKDLVNVRYLFYYFFSPEWRCVIEKNKVYGATVERILMTKFPHFPVRLPGRETQDRIANILSCIDEKITLNTRINHNLEEQAHALYKSWFVDFEPFKNGTFVDSELGMIPEGWVVRRLGDVCKCVLGGTPSRNNSEYWGGSIAWINSGAVNEFRIIEASEYITEKGLNSSATKLLPNNTVVLAITGATLGQFSILAIPSCANQSVIGILQNGKFPTEYIYPLIANRIDDLMLAATGGAQQHINKNNVEELYVLEPTDDVMSHYLSLTRPLYEQINAQYLESNKLSCTRDYLLPRLMDGFISV